MLGKLFRILIRITICVHGIIILIFLSNCVGTVSTTNYQTFNKPVKKAYIISSSNSKFIEFKFGTITGYGTYVPTADDPTVQTEVIGNTDEVIKEELKKYGITATIGEKGDKPEDFDFIVEYNDTWRWDFTEVLDELEIYFITPDGQEIIAESHFKIGSKEFHNYPTPEKEIPQMINEMIEKSITQ